MAKCYYWSNVFLLSSRISTWTRSRTRESHRMGEVRSFALRMRSAHIASRALVAYLLLESDWFTNLATTPKLPRGTLVASWPENRPLGRRKILGRRLCCHLSLLISAYLRELVPPI